MATLTATVDERSQPASSAALHPIAPGTLAEAGLSFDLMTQLVLKQLHFGGDLTGLQLASRLGVRYSVIEPVLEGLRHTHQCEVSGGSLIGGATYQYRITDAGRRRALLFLEQSMYIGVAPVPLAQYRAYMSAYAGAVSMAVTRHRVREAYSHLVLGSRVLDQIGPAVAGGHSLFVYGPPGNGKTVIAQAVRNLLSGEIAIPHAIEVEGQIIRLFDPVNHEPLAPASGDRDDRLAHDDEHFDARWVRCRRPMVTVGGELDLAALELAHASSMGFYTAPVQAIANGGVLVVDDFGRQRCSPRDLLNRWIVPLESRVDYLTLQTGQKFDLPFMVLVVFATNLKPSSLVDEAFLRRIRYKVYAEGPTEAEFREIFSAYCRQQGLLYDGNVVDEFIARSLRTRKVELRGCHPRDLIGQALALAEYLGQPRVLTADLLEAACATYFVDEDVTN